jgi:hypothetical protein
VTYQLPLFDRQHDPAGILAKQSNVLDNRNLAQEVWLRGGLELKLASGLTLKSQAYAYGAERSWFNNEVEAFNATSQQTDAAVSSIRTREHRSDGHGRSHTANAKLGFCRVTDALAMMRPSCAEQNLRSWHMMKSRQVSHRRLSELIRKKIVAIPTSAHHHARAG